MTLALAHPPLKRADSWLRDHRRFAWIALAVAACALRLVAFAELGDGPMLVAHRHSQSDMQFFHEWAEQIAEEDVLGREPNHPNHDWHTVVAIAYYKRHSELLAAPIGALDPAKIQELSRKLWAEWYGGARFHQEPLYAYLLASVFAIQRSDAVRTVLILQLLGGVVTVLLLYLATRRLFGDLVGVSTAIVALLWGPLIHYEMTLLRTSLLSLVGVGLLYATQRMADLLEPAGSSHRLRLFGYGCLIGLATAFRSTFLLVGVGFLLVLFWPARKQPRQIAIQGATIAAGIVLMLLPIWVRNALVGAPLFSLTSVGAVTFAGVNVSGSEPSFGWYPRVQADAIALVMDRSGGSLLGAIKESIATHESLWSFLRLQWGKLLTVWLWFELPNNTNVYVTQRFSSLLQTMRYIVSAAWIMPAALIGILIALRQRRPVAAWVWYLLCCLVPMVVFYTLSRFRAPMIVAMLPFAVFAIAQGVDWAFTGRTRQALVIGLVFAGMVLFMCRAVVPERPLVGVGTYIQSIQHYYLPKVEAARARGDHAGAIEVLEGLLATRPAYIDDLGAGRSIANDEELLMARAVFGVAYDMAAADAAAGKLPSGPEYEAHAKRLQRAARDFVAQHDDPFKAMK